jgi:hypothetical protein
MNIENSEFAPVYHALDIAIGYLTRRGYSTLEAKERSIQHIARLYRQGERRALVLANTAISAIERGERIERESQGRIQNSATRERQLRTDEIWN